MLSARAHIASARCHFHDELQRIEWPTRAQRVRARGEIGIACPDTSQRRLARATACVHRVRVARVRVRVAPSVTFFPDLRSSIHKTLRARVNYLPTYPPAHPQAWLCNLPTYLPTYPRAETY